MNLIIIVENSIDYQIHGFFWLFAQLATKNLYIFGIYHHSFIWINQKNIDKQTKQIELTKEKIINDDDEKKNHWRNENSYNCSTNNNDDYDEESKKKTKLSIKMFTP